MLEHLICIFFSHYQQDIYIQQEQLLRTNDHRTLRLAVPRLRCDTHTFPRNIVCGHNEELLLPSYLPPVALATPCPNRIPEVSVT